MGDERRRGPGPGVAKTAPERYPLRFELMNRIKNDPTIPRRVHDRFLLLASVMPLYAGEEKTLTHEQLAKLLKRAPRTTKAIVWDLADPDFDLLGIRFQFERAYRDEAFAPDSPRHSQRGNLYYLKWPERYGLRRDAAQIADDQADEADDEASDEAPPAAPPSSVDAPAPARTTPSPKRRAPRSRPDPAPAPASAPSASPSAPASAAIPRVPTMAERARAEEAALCAAASAHLDPLEREILVELALGALACPSLEPLARDSFVPALCQQATEAGIDLPVELPRLLKVVRDMARKASTWTTAQIAERFPRFCETDLGSTVEDAIRSRLKPWRELADRNFCGRLVRHARERGIALPALLDLLREALATAEALQGNELRQHLVELVRGPKAAPDYLPPLPVPVEASSAYRGHEEGADGLPVADAAPAPEAASTRPARPRKTPQPPPAPLDLAKLRAELEEGLARGEASNPGPRITGPPRG